MRRNCSFGPDQEGATVMVFNPVKVLGDKLEDQQCPHTDPTHYLRVGSLKQMLEKVPLEI